MLALVVCAALSIGGASTVRSYRAVKREEAERLLRASDLGKVVLSIEAFHWDASELEAIPVAAPPDWRWTIHTAQDKDPNTPGPALPDEWLIRSESRREGLATVEALEVRGGRAYLIVTRGNRCAESILPLKLPGYSQRERPQQLRVRVPTCEASRVGMVEVPQGTFYYGGLGDPPVKSTAAIKETTEIEPTFFVDRTEVTNAAFGVFAEMSPFTGIAPRIYNLNSLALAHAHEPRKPVTNLKWSEAKAYCRFMGKALVSTKQWTKAMRGGHEVSGKSNSMPRRNVPWATREIPAGVRIKRGEIEGAADVATHADDVSPYGVYDLGGNVYEWTDTEARPGSGVRIIRGGDWGETTEENVLSMVAAENERTEDTQEYRLGMRCASKK